MGSVLTYGGIVQNGSPGSVAPEPGGNALLLAGASALALLARRRS
jgi:hypothetical protein